MEDFKSFANNITKFTDDSWQILKNCLTEITVNKGDKILEEGKICKSIYFIEQGLCRAYYIIDGKEINTQFFFERDFATNLISLKNETKSEYYIEANEKTKLIRIDKVKLLEAYSKSKQIESFGRQVLEIIILKQESHSNSFKLLSPKQRFEKLIKEQPEFLQRVSLTQIASYLGISRETLSRIRSIK